MFTLRNISARSESNAAFSRHAMFVNNLKRAGLVLRRQIPDDGNCLFHAVCDQLRRLKLTRMKHTELRQKTVARLKEDPYIV